MKHTNHVRTRKKTDLLATHIQAVNIEIVKDPNDINKKFTYEKYQIMLSKTKIMLTHLTQNHSNSRPQLQATTP
jgi:archaellum component FlaG (FlaF/FlaG flagellin family)